MKRKLLDLRFHRLIVQLAAHLLSYRKLIHQTVPFRNQEMACWCRYYAGAKLAPCLAPPSSHLRQNQPNLLVSGKQPAKTDSVWLDWVGGAAGGENVLGLWTGLLSPHPPHTHEEGKARGGGPAHRYKDPPKQPYLTSCSSELNQ